MRQMFERGLLVGLVWGVGLVGIGWAQAATPGSRLTWDQQAATIAEAQALTYRYYADASTSGSVITATCVGAVAPFTCSAPFPAFTPGAHTLKLTAENVAGESAQSAALAFTFVVIPAVPANVRIQ